MKIDRLRTDQSMLKMSTPATISIKPSSSSSHQLRAMRSATSRVSFRWNCSGEPGAMYIGSSIPDRCLFSSGAIRLRRD